MDKASFLKKKADQIRDDIINVAANNNAGHIAPSLSSVDILVALYYNVMKYKSEDPFWENRDRLIFSKGHGCYGLYAILADKGVMPAREWKNFYTSSSSLSGCIERRPEYGFEASCGSLGHGLPIAVGIAFGAKMLKKSYHIFCVVGDGELQEGTTWEALQFAVKHEIGNLTVIVDSNRLQAMDFIINVLDRKEDDIIKRLRGFGMLPLVCPGHDAGKLARVLLKARSFKSAKRPNVIIAKTVKGFGFKCMEGIPKFHFRIPEKDELEMGTSYECRAKF